MEINSSTVWGAAVAAPLPWSFVYFWYICLVIVEWLFSEHGISVSDRNSFPGILTNRWWKSSTHCFFVLNWRYLTSNFHYIGKHLDQLVVCVFVIFRFSRAGKDILGKFFTTCLLEHPPNNSPKVYQWNPYKVEQGGFQPGLKWNMLEQLRTREKHKKHCRPWYSLILWGILPYWLCTTLIMGACSSHMFLVFVGLLDRTVDY